MGIIHGGEDWFMLEECHQLCGEAREGKAPGGVKADAGKTGALRVEVSRGLSRETAKAAEAVSTRFTQATMVAKVVVTGEE